MPNELWSFMLHNVVLFFLVLFQILVIEFAESRSFQGDRVFKGVVRRGLSTLRPMVDW